MSLHLFQSTYQSDSLVASPSLENIQERYEVPTRHTTEGQVWLLDAQKPEKSQVGGKESLFDFGC